ncbi:FG-GAP repeat protein, partial [Patescibacteria group bacterium]|nr:FG-GAP repeat protein [Patescibacteria group bacterium]
VFKKRGPADEWDQHAKIIIPDGSDRVRFGSSVAIKGRYLIAGAPHTGSGSGELNPPGAAYVFKRVSPAAAGIMGIGGGRPEDVWILDTTLEPPTGTRYFGHSVDIDGMAIVGQDKYNRGPGSVSIY